MDLAKWAVLVCLLHVRCGAASTRQRGAAKAESAVEFVKKEIDGERAVMESLKRRAAAMQARRQAQVVMYDDRTAG